jgi:dihydrodipicolinate synthase/N-acetylneuraminate lyase
LNENGYEDVIVIAGTGVQSTRETKKLCVDAGEAGASYALVLTPSTWPPQMTRENILRFHREVISVHKINILFDPYDGFLKVADASPIPTMIYNFPRVTAGIDLDSSIITELAAHPNIVGTKLSCGNIGKLHRITTATEPSKFAVFAGRSDVLAQGLMSDSAGAIAALANVAPKAHVMLLDLWKKGDAKGAMELQKLLSHADGAIGKVGGISGLKSIIEKEFGYGFGFVRGPLAPSDVQLLRGEAYQTLTAVINLEKSL